METKPYWWDDYFKSWSIEHNIFYETHKSIIFKMEKTIDWDKRIRSVTYSSKVFKDKTFTENF